MASSAAAAYEDDHIPTRERNTNVIPGSPLRGGENAPLSTHGTERLHSAAFAPLPALYPWASKGDVRPLQPLHLSLHRSLPFFFLSLSLSLSLSFSSSQADKHDRLQRSRLARLLRNSGPARSFTLSTLHLPFLTESSVLRQCPVEIWRHWQLTSSPTITTQHAVLLCRHSFFVFFFSLSHTHRLKLGITFPCSKLGC